MRLLIIIISIHFVAGAIGIVLSNRKVTKENQKSNWIKYFGYLLIFITVLSSIIIDKKLFLGIGIIIMAASLMELLSLGKQAFQIKKNYNIFFVSLAVFYFTALLFSLFILLPYQIIIYTFTIVVIFDGACQITGKLAGKRKILPHISPQKTWEGFFGGSISALLTSALLRYLINYSFFQSLLIGTLIIMASFGGDMMASFYKRAYGAKDFSNLLPGQGGMLDRFDSFLASGAIIGLVNIPGIFSSFSIDKDILVYLVYSLGYTSILIFTEILYIRFLVKAEYSRILSHILAGIASLYLMSLFSSSWFIIFLCIQSALFIFLTKRLGILGSHHDVRRNTNGSSIFFVGILVSLITAEFTGKIALFILPVAILTMSDPAASIIGLSRKSGHWPNIIEGKRSSKTYSGSISFFIMTLIILFWGLSFFFILPPVKLILFSFVTAILTTLAEAISSKGTDNLTIPLTASLLLVFFTYGI